MLNHNPPPRASIVCDLPMFTFWIDGIIDYAQHKDGIATLYRVIGPQWLRSLVEKSPRFLEGDVLGWDEAHSLRNRTEKQQTRMSALRTCAARFVLSGSFLCNGESDLFGFGEMMDVDVQELVEQDVLRAQQQALANASTQPIAATKITVAAAAAAAKATLAAAAAAAAKAATAAAAADAEASASSIKRRRGRPSKQEQAFLANTAMEAEEDDDDDDGEEEEETGRVTTGEGRIKVDGKVFEPTPQFFVDFLAQINGRVLFADPFRDIEQLEGFRTKRIESMRKNGKTEAEIDTQEKRFEEKRRKEQTFPNVHEEDIPLEMSWPQLYMTAKFSKNGMKIAGLPFQNSNGNFYEANSKMIANTFETPQYSTKLRAHRIKNADRLNRPPKRGEEAELAELRKFSFKPAPKYMSSPKAFRMANDTLRFGLFPMMVYSSLLDNGIFAYESCLRYLEENGGPPYIPMPPPPIASKKKKSNAKASAAAAASAAATSTTSGTKTSIKKKITTNAVSAPPAVAAASAASVSASDPSVGVKGHPMAWLLPPTDTVQPLAEGVPWDPTVEHETLRVAHWTGDENDKQRTKMCREYKRGQIPIMAASKAGGRGLDFGSGAMIMLMGPGDNLPEQKQASSRIVRMNSEFADVYIRMYYTIHPKHAWTEEEIQEMQEIWEHETGNHKESGHFEPVLDDKGKEVKGEEPVWVNDWEDVRDQVIPELIEWARTHRSFEERKRESNFEKAARLIPYELTIECADPIAPMATKLRWNEVTRQPRETKLRTTHRKRPTSITNDGSEAVVDVEEDPVDQLTTRLRADVYISSADQTNLISDDEEEEEEEEEEEDSDEDGEEEEESKKSPVAKRSKKGAADMDEDDVDADMAKVTHAEDVSEEEDEGDDEDEEDEADNPFGSDASDSESDEEDEDFALYGKASTTKKGAVKTRAQPRRTSLRT